MQIMIALHHSALMRLWDIRYPSCYMKNTPIKLLTALLVLQSTSLQAGEVEEVIIEAEQKKKYIDFSGSARLRYEARNAQGLEQSHAGTLRVRPGFTILPEHDFSFYVESEHTLALIEDYQVGTPQSANFTPFQAGNTPIADPETNEINQLYGQFKRDGWLVRVGRQRLIFDKAAFIGNVGWRQNEQTFDAALIKYKKEDFEISYAYADEVNRIFGSDATGPVEALEGDVHLLNAKRKWGDHTFGGYVYYMDFSDQAAGFPTNASNSTLGVFGGYQLNGGKLYTELAYQTEAGNKADYEAFYGHVKYTRKFDGFTFLAGMEYLEDGFVTPLATVHAYNGYADTFIGNRLGLANTWDGLADFYVGVDKKFGDVMTKARVHYFTSDDLSDTYGWELDLVGVKKLTEDLKLLGKAAYYLGEDGSPFANDLAQISIQLDYTF